MAGTDSGRSSRSSVSDKKVDASDSEDTVKKVLDIANKAARAKKAEAVAPRKMTLTRNNSLSGRGWIKEAEGVTARITELEDTMNKAISLIDTAKAEASPEEGDIAKAITSAINEMEPWRDMATAESMKAKVAKEEVEALRSEVVILKRELDIANAKVLAVGGGAAIQAIGPKDLGGGPIESPSELPAAPVESYLCRSLFPTRDDTLSHDSAIFTTKRLWPNGQVITYRFMDGHANQQAKVPKVIPEWSRYANITFKLVSNDALIRISFKNSSECWSYIGTDSQKTGMNVPYMMGLGAVSTSSDITPGDRALILHQFGHILGLVHEHMCPSDTDVVSLRQEAILNHPSFQDADPSINNYLSIYANSSVTNYTSPDLSSIMIFSMPGELNEGNFAIEPNTSLSSFDKAFMVINYPRARVHSQAPQWTLHHALLIANVDENTRPAITEEHDLAKRRILFANFLSRGRQQDLKKVVHPAPKVVDSLNIPAIESALHELLVSPNSRPEAKEVFADTELKNVLVDALNHLISYPGIRKVIQQAKASLTDYTSQGKPDSPGSEPAFVGSLVRVALMFHSATKHWGLLANTSDKARPKQADAATTLYTHLAQHPTFRAAMEKVVEGEASPVEAVPDISALLEQLAERPAVLRAIRKALI